MIYEYQRPAEPGAGLRLHLNENTAGCSPRVIEALARLTAEQVALYPDYRHAARAVARHFGVDESMVLLTNGLDEGILATSVTCFRRQGARPSNAVIVEPAFDMYAACADAAGGRVLPVAPKPDFSFPLTGVLTAISEATRLVFLTNPNNPTGQLISDETIETIVSRVPSDALVFLDEAYAEFCGESLIPALDRFPRMVIGRTFAKAYGLAGLRIGALIGQGPALAPIRRVIPPYSVNIAAVVGICAALEDQDGVRQYVAEVAASKSLLYEACQRLGLECWPSSANFVLVRVGDRAGALVAGLTARGVFVRDRTREPGCEGCVRITAGVVEHTKRCIAGMEEILCDAP